MKKNRTMRIAAVMLVFALLTTCIISGSFAKYITTGTAASEAARVAKWGVTVEAAADSVKIADDVYGTTVAAFETTTGGNTTGGIMAPGTSKESAAVIAISGQPEVAVKILVEADVTVDGWLDKTGAFYFPLTVTVGGIAVDLSSCTDAAGVKNAIKAAIEGAIPSATIAPNTDLGDAYNNSLKISWAWPFGADDNKESGNDAKDTYLGDQAAKGNLATFGVSITVKVIQVD